MSINYPTKKRIVNNDVNYANRGMSLEKELDESNKFYKVHNIALIYKKPTPIQIVKVDYPIRQKAVIKEAYFQAPSTTDYNGIYKQKYIDFEAKEVKQKKSFPLSNINAHQIKHIRSIIDHNGIAFIIVRFTLLNKTFLLKGEDLISFVDTESSKSIPLSVFENKGYIINESYVPRIDYIKVVNDVYLGGKKWN